MKKIQLLTALLLIIGTLQAQTYKKFEWAPRPALQTVTGKNAEEAAVFLNDDRYIEYSIEKEGLFIYKTVHRLVHINTDKGIESFNKVYLPFDEGMQMMDVKARTILPNGRIITLDEKNIKDLQEENRSYKIFALDGLAKGCEVEYYYTLKKYPSFFGREFLGYHIPVTASHFELVVPASLKFDTRTYNGLPDVRDSVIGEKRYLTLDVRDLKPLPDERYSMTSAHQQRIEFKLSYNLNKNKDERLFSWDELARKANDIYTVASDKEVRKIRELVEAAGVTSAQSVQEKVTRIETYLKKYFNISEDIDSDDADDLLKVIKGKNASEKAVCKIAAIALAEAGVEFEIVLTGDRSDYTVDKKFENWNNARNFLLYFPALKKYMAPSEVGYRYPFVPPTWAGGPGLYIVRTKLGNIMSAYAEFKKVGIEDVKSTYSNMDIQAELDNGMDSLQLNIKQSYGGYIAANYRTPFVYYPPDEHYKVVKQFISFSSQSEQIKSWELKNKEFDQADPYAPFILTAKVNSSELVERAGSKIIVKVGMLIGEQSELYEEKERVTDIELGYPHSFKRVIDIKIPAGYTVQNLKDLALNQSHSEGGQVQFNFVSTYKLEGNMLHIEVEENYNGYFYPKNIFEVFKKVINAAADFNKVVLVLDKQK
ncbi:MAG: DUF3857 domain-containing protein [Chitinophagaceae bacterium]|nr:MAG: DUF3857 domain-containing protein [Chitinophagaceae bacterium]